MTAEQTQWHLLIGKYKSRGLYKEDVIELLHCGIVPPPEALPMIADIMADEGLPLQANRRPKTVRVDDGFVLAELNVPQRVDELVTVYDIPVQRAKTIVLSWYNKQPGKNLSMRQLEEWRKKWRTDDDNGQAEYVARLTNAWRDAQ